MPFARLEPLQHDLARHYTALRAIRNRKLLARSPLWPQIGEEVARVTSGVERGDHAGARPPAGKRLRVAAWNIQRGARFEGLRRALVDDPVLSTADVLLLVEVDLGMGRSGNRNVARELAEALGLSYAFGVSYLTLEDDLGENPDGAENTLSLAGAAILSRAPIERVENVDLPELRDKFSSSEKRLGKKRALLAELALADGPLVVTACHLDSNASPAQRALQLRALLDRAEASGVSRLLVGGDFNSTTYDVSGSLALARDLLHKYFFTGFRGTVENYMTPERLYEQPIFAELAARGYALDGLNDRARGSYHYDFNHPYAIAKTRQKVGRLLTWLLQRRLRPWNGVVPARLDWFAARGLRGENPQVVPPPREPDGALVSDHSAITVDLVP